VTRGQPKADCPPRAADVLALRARAARPGAPVWARSQQPAPLTACRPPLACFQRSLNHRPFHGRNSPFPRACPAPRHPRPIRIGSVNPRPNHALSVSCSSSPRCAPVSRLRAPVAAAPPYCGAPPPPGATGALPHAHSPNRTRACTLPCHSCNYPHPPTIDRAGASANGTVFSGPVCNQGPAGMPLQPRCAPGANRPAAGATGCHSHCTRML
jgi:hypothetical protein